MFSGGRGPDAIIPSCRHANVVFLSRARSFLSLCPLVSRISFSFLSFVSSTITQKISILNAFNLHELFCRECWSLLGLFF